MINSEDPKSAIAYLAIIIGVSLYYPVSIHAASYQSSTTSAIELGNAGAGAAADTTNLANIAVNPAIIAAFSYPSMAIAVNLVKSDQDINGEQYSSGDAAALDNPDVGDNYIVPSGYFALPINKKWSFGFASFSNYNARNSYANDYAVGQLAGNRSLSSYEMNPNIAVKLTDDLYLGAGMSIIYANYKLTTNYGVQNPNNPSQTYQDYAGSGIGFRFNIGMLYKLNNAHQFGLSYRNSSDIETEGMFTTLDRNNQSIFQDSASLNMAVPSELTLSAVHQLAQPLSIQYSFAWYDWQNLNEISVSHPDCPANLELNLAQGQCLSESIHAEDSWKAAFALNYKLNDTVLLRSGIATEQTTESATIALPFDQRTNFSIGLSYYATPSLSFDVGLSYAKYQRDQIIQTIAASSFEISSQGSSTLLGLQLNYQLMD